MNLSQESFQRIVDNLHDGLYLVDRRRVITYWNKAAERISGFSAAEVVGKSCADNILTHVDGHGCALCTGTCPLAETMCDGQLRRAEIYLHHKDGHRIPVSVRASPLTDDAGEVVGGIELFTDISHQAANELKIIELERLALLDNLTQLANRTYVEREIRGKFEEMKRFDQAFGCLFMDIDHFKAVNDRYGHLVGDAVLKFIARTLTANARPFDVYGRWGGEEFAGIIRCIGEKDLARLGNRLRALIETSYLVHEGERISVTMSIGATLFRADDTPESLIKRADELLYRSKREGRNRLTLG